jgi:cell division transport system ATP-binding protein
MKLLTQINVRGTTVVMVTHARDIVNRMGKRVIAIEDGKIVRDDAEGVYGYND